MRNYRIIKLKSRLSVFTIILFIYFLYHSLKYNSPYEDDYYKVMLLENNYDYSDVISVYGLPQKTICNKEEINSALYYNYTIVYPDFNVSITSINKEGVEFAKINKYITVTSDKFKFGSSKICVGSSKEQVQSIYRKYKKTQYISVDSNSNIDVYLDNYTRVEFYYNNDKVEKIIFYLYYY